MSLMEYNYGRMSCISSIIGKTLDQQTLSDTYRDLFVVLDRKINRTLCCLLDVVYAINKDDQSTTATPYAVDPNRLVNHEVMAKIGQLPNAPSVKESFWNDWQIVVAARVMDAGEELKRQMGQLLEQSTSVAR